jgi:hypothetical protein
VVEAALEQMLLRFGAADHQLERAPLQELDDHQW